MKTKRDIVDILIVVILAFDLLVLGAIIYDTIAYGDTNEEYVGLSEKTSYRTNTSLTEAYHEPNKIAENVRLTIELVEEEPEWTDVTLTAYCPCEKCCGEYALNRPNGIVYTASGAEAVEGVTVAADWSIYPPGTVLFIEGLGERIVQDSGSAVKGNRIDVYFESHDRALEFGLKRSRMYVKEAAKTLW